jgi:invasion protein IalB
LNHDEVRRLNRVRLHLAALPLVLVWTVHAVASDRLGNEPVCEMDSCEAPGPPQTEVEWPETPTGLDDDSVPGRTTHPDDAELAVKPFQDWRAVCELRGNQRTNCKLMAQVARARGGPLLSLSVDDPTPGSSLQVMVPQGVMLDPGLGFSVGDGALRVLPYETCVPAGCMVLVPLDRNMLQALKSSNEGNVIVVPGNGPPVTIQFSLKGFAEGIAYLEQTARDSR